MKYSIYKTPRKDGDKPLETYTQEPLNYVIEQKALKYGSITVVKEEELNRQI